LDFKQTGFDSAGTPKPPQQACQPMNELKLDHRSWINVAYQDTLERAVGPSIFEIPNGGLVDEPIMPSAA
jgi:hypothetical protein